MATTSSLAVTVNDINGKPCKIGSIVEIVQWSTDSYRGLWFIQALEAGGGRRLMVVLSQTRNGKWDLKVNPARIILRSYEPERVKGDKY